MNDKQFYGFLRKILPVLLLSLFLCLVTGIVFAGIYSSEQKAYKNNPQDTSEDSQSSELTGNTDTDTTDNESSGQAESETNTTDDTDVILKSTADAGQEYIDKIVFLGDSTTYGLSYYKIVKENQVWTGAGQNGGTNGTLSLDLGTIYFDDKKKEITGRLIYYPDDGSALNIAQAAAEKKPEYLVITLGINGVLWSSTISDNSREEAFKKSYRNVIEYVKEASPDTVIILQNIFPIASNAKPTMTNEKINTANEWIKDLAREYGLKYLNSQEVLKDADGYLQFSYQSGEEEGDGIHMKPEALKVIIKYIREHAYNLQ